MKKVGRPKDDFSNEQWNLIDSLVILEASEQYIAERLLTGGKVEINALSVQAKIKQLQRKIKDKWDCNFVQYREQKSDHRKISLRKSMWRAVDNGNVTMMIWLSKQILGYTDKSEIGLGASNPESLTQMLQVASKYLSKEI